MDMLTQSYKHVALCILVANGRYLLQLKDKWTLFGWSIDFDESPLEALAPAINKQTELDVRRAEYLGSMDLSTADQTTIFYIYYADVSDQIDKFVCHEGIGGMLFTDEELGNVDIEQIVRDMIFIKQLEDIRKDKKVAMCHGVFDVLHYEHMKLIDLAKENADYVIVSLVADRFVDKGPGRPVIKEADRAYMLSSLRNVNKVIITNAYFPFDSIKCYKPDVWVHGGRDVVDSPENGLLEELKIPIVVRTDGLNNRTISSTQIIEGMKK
jgi:cytidyltransferase-like protein